MNASVIPVTASLSRQELHHASSGIIDGFSPLRRSRTEGFLGGLCVAVYVVVSTRPPIEVVAPTIY
jgi:hypothetical protein